jgi:hypothetical protein
MIYFTRVKPATTMTKLIIVLTLLLSSCSLLSSNDNGAYVKSKNYLNEIQKSIHSPWEEVKGEGADFAMTNKKTSSTFLINSSCRKNEQSSLNALSSSLLNGIENISIISKNVLSFEDREAQEIRFSGSVDGVKTFINIMTVQKNYCIYDFVLISKNIKKLDIDYSTFKSFLEKVKIP